MVSEQSACFLGNCAPTDTPYYRADSVTVPAAYGPSCAGEHPNCTAWVTVTRSANHYCYYYLSCPAEPQPVVSDKRTYTCYLSKLNRVNSRLIRRIQQKAFQTRMHSSRMRTACFLTVCHSVGWGICPPETDPYGCRPPLDAIFRDLTKD